MTLPAGLDLRPCETLFIGDVLVGLWQHERCRADWDSHLSMLDDRELRRLAELSSPRRAAAFVAGRCCARALLTQSIDRATPAAAWRIEVDIAGKPKPYAPRGYGISVSHGRGLSVVALRRGSVGIDVEPQDCDIAADLPELQGNATPLERLSAWTAREARLKLDGTPMAETMLSGVVTTHAVYRSHLIAVAKPASVGPTISSEVGS